MRRRFGLDSRDSEAVPPLVESVLSGFFLVIAFEVVEREMYPLGREGKFFQNVLPLLVVLRREPRP